jgi:hypothetical protein
MHFSFGEIFCSETAPQYSIEFYAWHRIDDTFISYVITIVHVNSPNMIRWENKNAHTTAHIRLYNITISMCSWKINS